MCISGLQNHPSQALGAVGTPVYTLNVRLPAAFRINYIDTAAAPSPRLRRHTRGESPRCASAPPLTLFPLLCCRGWHGFAKALSIPSPTPASCWGFSPHHLLLRHPSQHLFPAPLPAPSPRSRLCHPSRPSPRHPRLCPSRLHYIGGVCPKSTSSAASNPSQNSAEGRLYF